MANAAETFALARQYHQAGSLSHAKQLYSQVLQAEPTHAEALHLLGVLASQEGQHEAAVSHIQQALTQMPTVAVFHNNLGFAYQSLGKLDEAATHYRQALKLRPNYAVAFCNLGAILQTQGKCEEAERSLREALRLKPDYALAHTVLGNTLAKQGKLEKAVACHHQALRLDPGCIDAYVNLGFALNARGEMNEAIACYNHALKLKPDSLPALVSLAAVLSAQGKLDEADACYRTALRLQPDHAEVHHDLGTMLHQQGKTEEAIACQQQALRLRPEYAEVHAELGNVLTDQFRLEEAKVCFEEAQRLKPSAELRIQLATLLPAIHQSLSDLRSWRERFTDNLRQLHEDGVKLDITTDVASFPFFLAYHGMNDRDLNRQMASLYSPPAEQTRSRPRDSGLTGNKIRIGFISRHFKMHTIGLLMRGLIAQLSRDKFAVTVLSIGGQTDFLAEWIRQHADSFVELPFHLPSARRIIAEHNLDVLFYTDIGMDTTSYSLAFSRLAPVQCVTWGHPVTTGVDTIDYFISSQQLECEHSEDQYTEKLVQLKTLPIYYYRPEAPVPLRDRASFGLPETGTLYACPQSPFKLHPELDEILGGILRQDPEGQLVLSQKPQTRGEQLLRQRFATTMPDVLDRIHFVPSLDYFRFLNLNAIADVLLDPIHFGGGNTSYEGLALGVPIVTLPSKMLRGRITYALYHQMGVMDCVVQDAKEYVDLAVKLGTDAEHRAAMSAKIKAACGVLFENSDGIRELEQFLQQAVATANS